ncbi:MAG: hypothetical protein ACM3VZ_14165 [Acidobacteriota bacterium]
MNTRRSLQLLPALCASVVMSGCGHLASRADEGCQLSFRDAQGWSIEGASLPLTRLPDGTSWTVGQVRYDAAQTETLRSAAYTLDEARKAICATMYAPEFAQVPDADREELFGRVIAVSGQLNQLGKALMDARTPEAGVQAAQDALRRAALVGPSDRLRQPHRGP